MAKMYDFPTKKELPKSILESLQDIAEAYVATLDYAFSTMLGEDPGLEEVDDLRGLIMDELEEALNTALFNSEFK